MVPLANEQRVLGYGVGVVEYDVGENARSGIFCAHLRNLLSSVGKNVQGGCGAQETVRNEVG